MAKNTCSNCKFWKLLEKKEFGTCLYPVPIWLKTMSGVARITYYQTDSCDVWAPIIQEEQLGHP